MVQREKKKICVSCVFQQFGEQNLDPLLNDPKGPNLAPNLAKCYLEEVERSQLAADNQGANFRTS